VALLDSMLGRLLADLWPADAATEPADWRQRLRTIAHLARGLAHRHPWAAMLIFSRPSVAPDAVRVVDQIYAALVDAGVPDPEVARVERLLSTFVIGYAASEPGGRFSTGSLNPRGRRDQLAAEELPAHHALATWLDTPVDWDAEFETDLDDLVRLVEAIA